MRAYLVSVVEMSAVVAQVSPPVSVLVSLPRVVNERAVVCIVDDAISVSVDVAAVSCPVPIRVSLVDVGGEGAVVASIANAIVIAIHLVRIEDKEAIILQPIIFLKFAREESILRK